MFVPWSSVKRKHVFIAKASGYACVSITFMILCCIKDSRAAPSQSPPSSKRCKEDLFWFTALTTVSSNEYWNYGAPRKLTMLMTWTIWKHRFVNRTVLTSPSTSQSRWRYCQQWTNCPTWFQCFCWVRVMVQLTLRLSTTFFGSNNTVALYAVTTSALVQTCRSVWEVWCIIKLNF